MASIKPYKEEKPVTLYFLPSILCLNSQTLKFTLEAVLVVAVNQ